MKKLMTAALAVAACAAGAAPADANSPVGTVKCLAGEGTKLAVGVVTDPGSHTDPDPTYIHVNC